MNFPFPSLGARMCVPLARISEGLPCRNSWGQAFMAESDQRGVIGFRSGGGGGGGASSLNCGEKWVQRKKPEPGGLSPLKGSQRSSEASSLGWDRLRPRAKHLDSAPRGRGGSCGGPECCCL